MLKNTFKQKSNAKRNAFIAVSLVAVTLLAAIAVFVQTALQQSQDSRSDASVRGYDPKSGRMPANMGGGCIADVAKCNDGSFVSRDASKNCQFKSCPDGSTPGTNRPAPVGTPGSNAPGFRTGSPLPAQQPVGCAADVAKCSDGSFVSRDSMNNCQFKACPDGKVPSTTTKPFVPPTATPKVTPKNVFVR